MDGLRLVFMGTPDFAVRPLEYLVAGGYDVVAAYTQPDRTAGRGRLVVESPVKKAAAGLGIRVMQPLSVKAAGALAELAGLRPDVIVIAAYGQILPPAALDVPRYGCINVHPSLLPRYRGVSPVTAAILGGDDFAGVSIMLLDAGTDTGPILARAQVPVSDQDTTGSLSEKLERIGGQLILDVLPRWVKGNLEARTQDGTRASYCRKIAKQDGEIDWGLPAVDIWRRVRAYNPWPGAYTGLKGRQLRILEAVPLSGEGSVRAGEIVDSPGGGAPFGVATGKGILGVRCVQMEGKKALSAAEFMRGQRGLVGTVLPEQAG